MNRLDKRLKDAFTPEEKVLLVVEARERITEFCDPERLIELALVLNLLLEEGHSVGVLSVKMHKAKQSLLARAKQLKEKLAETDEEKTDES